jgi:uncharacterized SAM-binding protein YcdF (DUF218 family)
VIYESASRTTYENAIFSAALPQVDRSKPWLLLTSAYHMPRAMAVFRKTGWNVTAYPVDFRTGEQTPWTQWGNGCCDTKWRLLLHETIGMLAHRLRGASELTGSQQKGY